MAASRILIVANKSWEAGPLVGVLRSDHGRPSSFPKVAATPPSISIPSVGGVIRTVPARVALTSPAGTAEVWCVQDLMDAGKSASSSEEKARVLPYVAAAGDQPSFVVAFGTASLPDQQSFNGSVAVGSSIFIHDPYAAKPNPESKWTHADIGRVLDTADQLSSGTLASLGRDHRAEIESRFLTPPLNSARPPVLLSSAVSVAISNVNVTNQDNYVWTDPEALEAFKKAAPRRTIASVETTHGVIRLAIPCPRFLFVSGIANRLGYFNAELSPRSYAQNFAASHNAGIVTAWIISHLLN
jgi:hypothetical protein